jgi:hypothetical protein
MNKNVIKNHVYKMVESKRLCSKLYRDEDWSNVRAFFKAIEDLGYKVSYWVENGGYRTFENGGQCKDYQLTISLGEIVVNGYLTAGQAGTVADPWSAYDLTLILW